MRNIVLCLTYLGTAYHGWQVQKNLVTVAGTLEAAAEAVVGHRVHMTGCGRTDAGFTPGCMWPISAPIPPSLATACPMPSIRTCRRMWW